VHSLHIVSVWIAYIFVRQSTTSLETLRVLTIAYFILFVLDGGIVVVARVLMAGHHFRADGEHMPAYGTLLVHMFVSVMFVGIDISGAYLSMVAQHSLLAKHYTNDQLQSLAAASLYKTSGNENV
jgi:cytochrome c biogenesis factor